MAMARSCRPIRFTRHASQASRPPQVCGVGVMDRHFKPLEPTAVRVTFGGPLNFESLPDFTAPLRVVPD